MIKSLLCTGIAALALALPAQAIEIAAGARVSTLGPGLELATGISDRFTVRGVANGFNYSRDYTDDNDNDYEGKLKLFTAGLLLDAHPFNGVFRITAGGLANGFSLKGRTKGDQTFQYETDALLYNGSGSASAKADFPRFAPYLGIGWGRPIKSNGKFWFSFDLGVMFQGSLKADLAIRGSGTVTDKQSGQTQAVSNFENDPRVQADIASYERELEDEAKDFKYYPVIGFGLGYRF